MIQLKDSVIQHCKNCDKIIKGGHLAEHKLICKGNDELEERKIRIWNKSNGRKTEIESPVTIEVQSDKYNIDSEI